MRNEKLRVKYAFILAKQIKGFGFYLFFAVLFNFLYKVLPLITALVTSYLVGSVLMGNTEEVVSLMITSGGLVFFMAAFSYLDLLVGHDMAYRILTQLRDKCYDKLDELAPAALMDKRSGDMISIILNDVETLEWFYAHTISQIIVAVFVPTAALVFMGVFSWILPVVILPFIALLILIPKHSSQQSDSQGAQVRQTMGKLSAIIVDGIQGIKDIISFQWQQEYFSRFFRANAEYSGASMTYAKRRANENRRIILLIEVATLVSYITATTLVGYGSISPLWLMPLFVLSAAIFSPIFEALNMSTNYGLIFGAAQRVINLLEKEPMVENHGMTRLDYDGKDLIVQFRNVSFTYPAEETKDQNPAVLYDMDFSFRTGETLALVGASGSGKTTVARLLQRFWDVDGGSISINTVDIREMPLEHLREIVTVVPQDVYLFNVNIAENLRLSCLGATDEEIQAAAKKARADCFIDQLPHGYDTVIGERALRLSGGEKQRLSIAQAFLKGSPVLVLDEVSASLDSENERLINQAIQDLKKRRATLVIAHRISTIRSADRIVALKDGRIAGEGTYEELMENCPYFRVLIGEEFIGKSEN